MISILLKDLADRVQEANLSVELETAALMTYAETAFHFGSSTQTVRRKVARGTLPTVRIGRRVLIPRSALEPAGRLTLKPAARKARTAEFKRLTVPAGSDMDVVEVLGACAGKFLHAGYHVTIDISDGEAITATVEAMAKKVESFLHANPGAAWRFSDVGLAPERPVGAS